jgi:hypothetical protein
MGNNAEETGPTATAESHFRLEHVSSRGAEHVLLCFRSATLEKRSRRRPGD